MGESRVELPNIYRCPTCEYVASRQAFRFDRIGMRKLAVPAPEYVHKQMRECLEVDADFRMACEREFVTTDIETIVRKLYSYVFEKDRPCDIFLGFCPACRSRCIQHVIGEIAFTQRLH